MFDELEITTHKQFMSLFVVLSSHNISAAVELWRFEKWFFMTLAHRIVQWSFKLLQLMRVLEMTDGLSLFLFIALSTLHVNQAHELPKIAPANTSLG